MKNEYDAQSCLQDNYGYLNLYRVAPTASAQTLLAGYIDVIKRVVSSEAETCSPRRLTRLVAPSFSGTRGCPLVHRAPAFISRMQAAQVSGALALVSTDCYFCVYGLSFPVRSSSPTGPPKKSSKHVNYPTCCRQHVARDDVTQLL